MIEVKELYKSFDSHQVLKSISLKVKDKERIVILGRSGSGKTVLLKCITGLLTPDKGRVVIDGIEVTSSDEKGLFKILRRIGFVFQGSALLDSLTVRENISLGPKEQGIRTTDEIVYKNLELVGLEKRVADLYPSELSGGMKKLVAIARAVALSPKYLFYDEPTSALDPVMRERIIELILSLSSKLSTTSIIVTHDLILAKRVAERILFLKGGSLLLPEHIENIEEFYE